MEFDGLIALLIIFLLLAIPISIGALIFSSVSRIAKRKQQLNQTIITEYAPPAHLSPAEIGYIFDSKIGKLEMLASLVSLEQRGLISISKQPLTGLSFERAVAFPPDTVSKADLLLLDKLTSAASFNSLYLLCNFQFKRCVKQSLFEQGYLLSPKELLIYYAKHFAKMYGVTCLSLFSLFVLFSGSVSLDLIASSLFLFIFGWPFFLALSVVTGFIFNKNAGQSGIWSQKLKALWPQIEGFRIFVERVELDNIQFDSAELKAASQNQVLPYAIALGLETNWEQRFN